MTESFDTAEGSTKTIYSPKYNYHRDGWDVGKEIGYGTAVKLPVNCTPDTGLQILFLIWQYDNEIVCFQLTSPCFVYEYKTNLYCAFNSPEMQEGTTQRTFQHIPKGNVIYCDYDTWEPFNSRRNYMNIYRIGFKPRPRKMV